MLRTKVDGQTLSLIALVFLVSMILGLFYVLLKSETTIIERTDYANYIVGAAIIKEGKGDMLYDVQTNFALQKGIIKSGTLLLTYRSLPFVALAFIPLSYLPLPVSYKLFAIVNILLLGSLTYFSGKVFAGIKKYRFWFLLPFLFLPNLNSLIQGQISLFLTLNFLLLYYLIKGRKSFLAGVFCALLLARPQYVIVLPFLFLIADKRKPFAGGFLLASLFLALTSIYISGLGPILAYPSFLLSTETVTLGSSYQEMFGLNSLLLSIPAMASLDYTRVLFINGLFFLLALYIYFKRYRLIGLDTSFVLATLLALLFAAHVLLHDLAILLIAIFILLEAKWVVGRDKKNSVLFSLILFLMPLLFWVGKPQVATVVVSAVVVGLLYKSKKL